MIVWLEDRRSTVLAYEKALREKGYKYLILSSITEVAQFLEDDADPAAIWFVIDIMLHGVDDLNAIGVFNAPTISGNRAGQVFVERFLRAEASPFIASPVVFLTERLVDAQLQAEVDALKRTGSGPVHIYQKYSQQERDAFVATLEGYINAPAR